MTAPDPYEVHYRLRFLKGDTVRFRSGNRTLIGEVGNIEIHPRYAQPYAVYQVFVQGHKVSYWPGVADMELLTATEP